MSSTYLPADVRTRIIDLMKEHKFSQKKLALSIGVHESTLSRFLNGTTEKLSEESVIRIAKTFNHKLQVQVGHPAVEKWVPS